MKIESYLLVAERLIAIDQVSETPNSDGVFDGWLRITTDEGDDLMGPDTVDEIDCLWSYLVDVTEDLTRGRMAETGLPNGGVDLNLAPEPGGRTRIEIDDWLTGTRLERVVSTRTLVAELCRAGIHFFTHLQRLNPAYEVSALELARLHAIAATDDRSGEEGPRPGEGA